MSTQLRTRLTCLLSGAKPGAPVRAAALIACLVGVSAANGAWAQSGFPAKPVKIIVPFPAGGVNDVLARIVADKLQAKWGQPVVIENKVGAAGNLGADLAAKSPPDGYTLLVAPPPPLAINQSLYKQIPYKAEEFTPITVLGKVANLFIVRKQLPVNSVKELIAYVRANPGKVTFGSQGSGATPHLTANLFMMLTGTNMVHVPYRGETLVYQDMVGERVDLFFGNVSGALALYRDGRIKVLAVADTARTPQMPDVPTADEAGMPGFVSTTWFAMVGPPKLAPALQTEISKATVAVLNMPDVQQKFRALSVEPAPMTPAATGAFIKDEAQRWGKVIRDTGIKVE
ncbi:MAG TPA: tripartite tricarboxylate transporter substrate binding protein [Xanthobacteraceae bacterium]|nr:tripartite tricarboxylate transporter substrate binding protein [Xanthobacteraceae bacterium]